jgi:hypothetical protein
VLDRSPEMMPTTKHRRPLRREPDGEVAISER